MSLERVSALEEELTAANQEVGLQRRNQATVSRHQGFISVDTDGRFLTTFLK